MCERVVAWLDSRKTGITMQVQDGTISMPELVAQVREQVVGAAATEVVHIEALIRQRLGRFTPPRTRGRQTPTGQALELAARLKNLLGEKVEVRTDAANLVISVSGAVGEVRVGDVEASAEAGTGGVAGKVKLGAADAIGDSVRKAEQAIRDIAGHLHSGGMPTDPYVRERIGKVTPAIGTVGSAVKTQEGPNVSVRVSAGGGPKDVDGQSVQEAHVGVSLVIAF